MYAISHAATALVLERRYPAVPWWPILVAVQAVELLWVVFTYAGVEHVAYTPNAVHLDAQHPAMLPTLILLQIVVTWLLVRWLGSFSRGWAAR